MKTPFDYMQRPNLSPKEYLLFVMNKLACSEKVVVIALMYIEKYFKCLNEKVGA